MNISNQQIPQAPPYLKEHILVVKRKTLFFNGFSWHGLNKENTKQYLDIIQKKKEFILRENAEHDLLYKQIIPYLIFKYEDHFFLMQRKKSASEKRLSSKYSLGIGGHLREKDLRGNYLIDWAQREFKEEVFYKGLLTHTFLGMINDDSNEVGKVHVGFVLLLEGDNPNIQVKSELNHGMLLTLCEIKAYYENMETWSQFVFNELVKNKQ